MLHALPVIRQYSRFRLNARVSAYCGQSDPVRGWCRNLGEGGASATFTADFAVLQQVRLELRLPGNSDPLELQAVVKHVNGFHYGFEFLGMVPAQRDRISEFGRRLNTTAFLLSTHPATLRVVQRLLQQIGVAHVAFGLPKAIQPNDPCVVVVDCEWPGYLSTMRSLRDGGTAENPVLVALLGADRDAQHAYENGADLILYKPVTGAWAPRVLATAFSLLRRKPPGADGSAFRAGASVSSSK